MTTLVACTPCDHARLHGWWGPTIKGTHCRHCHRSWTSLAQSHCLAIQPDGSTCCRHFGSDSAGDAHRIKDVCYDPKGFDRWETPSGVIWGGRDPVEGAARMAAAVAHRGSGSPPVGEDRSMEAGVDG